MYLRGTHTKGARWRSNGTEPTDASLERVAQFSERCAQLRTLVFAAMAFRGALPSATSSFFPASVSTCFTLASHRRLIISHHQSSARAVRRTLTLATAVAGVKKVYPHYVGRRAVTEGPRRLQVIDKHSNAVRRPPRQSPLLQLCICMHCGRCLRPFNFGPASCTRSLSKVLGLEPSPSNSF